MDALAQSRLFVWTVGIEPAFEASSCGSRGILIQLADEDSDYYPQLLEANMPL